MLLAGGSQKENISRGINMKIDFDTPLSVDNPKDVYSYLQGFKYACELFGVWKDGEQYIGIGDFTVTQIKKAIEDFIKGQV